MCAFWWCSLIAHTLKVLWCSLFYYQKSVSSTDWSETAGVRLHASYHCPVVYCSRLCLWWVLSSHQTTERRKDATSGFLFLFPLASQNQPLTLPAMDGHIKYDIRNRYSKTIIVKTHKWKDWKLWAGVPFICICCCNRLRFYYLLVWIVKLNLLNVTWCS
jgi:hypothetical protein